jgi:hypothetical protein
MPDFVKQLTVDKRIVPLLSKSAYQRSFAYAVREMVSNAYDADATTVHITIDLKDDEIVIEDNGNGMTVEEFDHYLRIAGQKRGRRESPKFGRKRIGQFGVGFLAVFPFCETLEITSTAENSDQLFTAKVPASKFFRETSKTEEVGELDIPGYISQDKNKRSDHYTRLRLRGLTDNAKRYFDSKPTKADRNSVLSWKGLEKLKWELQEDLPISFPTNSKLGKLLPYSEPYAMEVYLQGEKIYRNDWEGDILDHGEITASGIRFRYAIITAWKPVKPHQMRALKIRVNNVGVGPRDNFDVERTRRYSRFHWLTGEIQVLGGLDDALTLSRDSFVVSSEYEEFREKIVSLLRKQADYIELVDVAAKDMTKQVRGGKQTRVASKRDIVEKNIKKLVEKGFTVKTAEVGTLLLSEPVKVDKGKKEVIVIEGHPGLEDSITVSGRKKKVVYTSWDPKGDVRFSACRINDVGQIEVNTQYPLFKSKRYGEVFLKVHILALLAADECLSAKQMHEFLVQNLLKEFQEF